jgi:pimeloyl-ACP methyl ester carboxylesterase
MKGLEIALEQKKVDRFYVVGVSGGNPAAVTTAAFFGERVLALGSICGMAPFHDAPDLFAPYQRNGFNMARRTPEFLLRTMINHFLKGFDPATKLDGMLKYLHSTDQAVLREPHVRAAMLESVELARRHGSAGVLFDLKTMSDRWPVDWSKLRCRFHLWHGERDNVLPYAMSEYVHSQVPHASLKLYPEEGHYSLPIRRAEEILKDMIA